MDVVDWALASATGRRLARPGPTATGTDARAAVAELRALASFAVDPVRERSGLDAGQAPPAIAVDRPTWIDSNIKGFRVVLGPVLELAARDQPAALTAVSARVTAAQIGSALAFVSSKVLGQFEAFTPSGEGRLLLVAPNIVAAERQLGVDTRDFRLWVCLHEETHRVQFGGVPWLRDYFVSLINRYLNLSPTGASDSLTRLAAALSAIVSAMRGVPGTSLVDALQTPEQRAVFDQLTALMSVLEGHADYVMDDVGPEIVPSVALIRTRFEDRRADVGSLDGVMRRLLGIDAKMRQYSDGRAFVSGSIALIGQAGFQRIWTTSATLPTLSEVLDPDAWCRRIAPDLLP